MTYDGDDKSDWKIFHVDEPGLLMVTVHFDDAGGSCEAYLRDKYGAHVAREVQSNNPYIELTRRVADAVPVPVIASGGVGSLDHLVAGIVEGHADAVLAASIFHFGEHSIAEAKACMAAAGLPVRL